VRVDTPINLSHHFYDLACSSFRSPNDPVLARRMIDHGVTVNRMRCNDFFAERAANQMRERVVRGSVAPVSALITGIIGVATFDSDADRERAIEILGIGQSATIAGLELYESEFLFGSDNINSVRTLTMRALDAHGASILNENVGFYGAARHLIDHQMICTPANILELSQTAIREGRIGSASPIIVGNQVAAATDDRQVITTLARSLRMAELTADQVGALWWLSDLVQGGGTIDPDILIVLQERLAGLPLNPISTTGAARSVDRQLMATFKPLIDTLSPKVTRGFEVAKRLLAAEIAKAPPATMLDRTRSIGFELPLDAVPGVSRAQEVTVTPAGAD
jgi:hypothetical protein